MDFLYETKRLVLAVRHQTEAQKVLDFYKKNKAYFEAFELTRPGNFYTTAFQSASLNIEYQEILNSRFMRYWIYEKESFKKNPDIAPIIGSVCLSNIRRNGFYSGMFGYKLDHDYWGQGYALEACQKFIDILFSNNDMHRLEAFIMPSNEHSIRLIERLGFHYEGTDRKCIEVNHRFEDHLRYALLNPNWNR